MHPFKKSFVYEYTRKKEILIGTDMPTSPIRVIPQRVWKIAAILGKHAPYYFWLVSRIRKDGTTRFKIADAAAALGVSRRSIERGNASLVELGFIRVINRSWQGKLTYSEYELLPINDMLRRYDKVDATCCDKADATKRGQCQNPTPGSTATQQHQYMSNGNAAVSFPPYEIREASQRELVSRISSRGRQEAQRWMEVVQHIRSTIPVRFDTSSDSQILRDIHEECPSLTPEELRRYHEKVLLPIISSAGFFKSSKPLGFGWILKHRLLIEAGRYGGPKASALCMWDVGDRVRVKQCCSVPAGWVGGMATIMAVPREVGGMMLRVRFDGQDEDRCLSLRDVEDAPAA